MYPNPATVDGELVITLEGETGQASVEFYDGLGRLLHETPISGAQSNVLSITQLKTGAYYVKVMQGKNSALKKLLIQ